MNKLLASAALVALASCETIHPNIALDPAPLRLAKLDVDDQQMIQPVRLQPYPMPGQLKPIERDAPAPSLKPFERIDAANERAKIEPDLDRFVNAVQVYPFMEGSLYRLYAAPEQVTDIALEPGERLNSVSAGDTVRWIVGDTTSGTTSGEQTHILVKPIAPNLRTNLVIATDRRAYHLEMRSFRDTYMAAISWTYPEAAIVRKRGDAKMLARAEIKVAGVEPGDLNFRYNIDGDRPDWRPVRAFDDGKQVFIQFPDSIAQGEAPPLFILGRNGAPELVNYRMRGAYYVVDRLFAAAELRLGQKRQDVVRITRSDQKDRG